MTDFTHDEIRDALPELLYGSLGAARRAEIEAHLRGCAECAVELRALQMVKDAPSFAPRIDAVRISAMIAPYGGVPAERPRRTRLVWQMATLAAALVLVVTAVVSRRNRESAVTPRQVASSPAVNPPPTKIAVVPTAAVKVNPPAPHVVTRAHELQVAVALDGLSDGSVAQLVKDLERLDDLPSPEPENLGVGDPASGTVGGQ